MENQMNQPLKIRITGNTILARELRRKLALRFGEGTRASEILANLTDEELIQISGGYVTNVAAQTFNSNHPWLTR